MFHCHVNHHALRGMAFLFNVLPKPGTAGNPLPLPHPSASMMGWLAAAPDALACASCRSPLGPGVTAGGASLSDPHRPKASTAVLDVLLVVLGVALGVAATLTIIGFSRRHAAPGPGPQMQPGVSDADFKHVKPGGGAPLPPNNAVGQGVSGVTVEEEHNPTNGEESSHPAVVGERESLLLRSTLRSNAPYTVQGHV